MTVEQVSYADSLEAISLEEAFAEMARLGLMPFTGGDGSGEGDGDQGDPDGDDGDGGDGDKDSPAAKALAAERKARKAAEKLAKDLQRKVDDAASKDQSDLDRTKGDLTKAQQALEEKEAKLRETVAKSALISEATKANALRPDAVYKLVKDDADFDDDGEITNAAALIQQARKDAPELFGRQQGGSGNGGARDQDDSDDKAFGVSRMRNAYEKSSKQTKK